MTQKPSETSTDGGPYARVFTQKAKYILIVVGNSYRDLKILKTRSNLPLKVIVEQQIHVPD